MCALGDWAGPSLCSWPTDPVRLVSIGFAAANPDGQLTAGQIDARRSTLAIPKETIATPRSQHQKRRSQDDAAPRPRSSAFPS